MGLLRRMEDGASITASAFSDVSSYKSGIRVNGMRSGHMRRRRKLEDKNRNFTNYLTDAMFNIKSLTIVAQRAL
jgi:hypothetical protein